MNTETMTGETVSLMNAARKGETVEVQNLLRQGADVNATDALGRTALIIAANQGHTYIVQLLLNHGADLTHEDFTGTTALGAAESKGYSRISALLRSAQRSADSAVIPLLLHKAVDAGNVFGVQDILARGADVNARTDDGWTPLMLATVRGHVEIVKALLGRAADLEARNKKGWTALMLAVSMSDVETMRVLLDGGADTNSRDSEGKTALMQAASENNVESLKILMEYGADVSIADSTGETALTVAVRRGYLEIVGLLEEASRKDVLTEGDATQSQIAAQQSIDSIVDSLFSDFELGRLKEELSDFLPQTSPALVERVAADEELAPVAGVQALVPSQLAELGERLISAIETLRAKPSSEVSAFAISELAHKLLLTMPEAAALSGLSRSHLRRAVKEGTLKAQIIGRGWRIKRLDLDAYVCQL